MTEKELRSGKVFTYSNEDYQLSINSDDIREAEVSFKDSTSGNRFNIVFNGKLIHSSKTFSSLMNRFEKLKDKWNLELKEVEDDSTDDIIHTYESFVDKVYEDGDGGGAAVATASSTTGMGNVSSAQPASTPGAASTGDGTTGSGDYGNPLFPTANKDGSTNVGTRRGTKDKKKDSAIKQFVKNMKDKKGKTTKSSDKSSNLQSFSDFVDKK